MTDETNAANDTHQDATATPMDAFEAAGWFNDLWNSTAHAVAHDKIEWQCNTWGSGRGHGGWEDLTLFRVVAEVFEFSTYRNYEGRDEMIVGIPLEKAHEVISLIERIGDFPEMWVWLAEEYEDAPELRVGKAAEMLGRSVEFLAANDFLMQQLRLQ